MDNKNKFIFIHIPKTGGRSIKKSLGIPSKGHFPITSYKEKYFSFAFVRNPWDRVVSTFFYLNKGGIDKGDERDRDIYLSKYKGDFNHFIYGSFGNKKSKIFQQQHFRTQFSWVCNKKGKLAIDFLGKFENLQEDFNKICRYIGIKEISLPHKNKTLHKNYKKYYNKETKEIIAEAYRKDIEMFEYKY